MARVADALECLLVDHAGAGRLAVLEPRPRPRRLIPGREQSARLSRGMARGELPEPEHVRDGHDEGDRVHDEEHQQHRPCISAPRAVAQTSSHCGSEAGVLGLGGYDALGVRRELRLTCHASRRRSPDDTLAADETLGSGHPWSSGVVRVSSGSRPLLARTVPPSCAFVQAARPSQPGRGHRRRGLPRLVAASTTSHDGEDAQAWLFGVAPRPDVDRGERRRQALAVLHRRRPARPRTTASTPIWSCDNSTWRRPGRVCRRPQKALALTVWDGLDGPRAAASGHLADRFRLRLSRARLCAHAKALSSQPDTGWPVNYHEHHQSIGRGRAARPRRGRDRRRHRRRRRWARNLRHPRARCTRRQRAAAPSCRALSASVHSRRRGRRRVGQCAVSLEFPTS